MAFFILEYKNDDKNQKPDYRGYKEYFYQSTPIDFGKIQFHPTKC